MGLESPMLKFVSKASHTSTVHNEKSASCQLYTAHSN